MYDDYDVMADQIASDIGPVFAVSQEEAHMLARFHFPTESEDVIEGVADALYRSYRPEQWGIDESAICKSCPVAARLASRAQRRGDAA